MGRLSSFQQTAKKIRLVFHPLLIEGEGFLPALNGKPRQKGVHGFGRQQPVKGLHVLL